MQEVSSAQGRLTSRCQWDNPVTMHIGQLDIGLIQKYEFRRLGVAPPKTTGEGHVAWGEKRKCEGKIEGPPQFRKE